MLKGAHCGPSCAFALSKPEHLEPLPLTLEQLLCPLIGSRVQTGKNLQHAELQKKRERAQSLIEALSSAGGGSGRKY